MCTPVLAMAALSAATTAGSVFTQVQQAKTQKAAIQAQHVQAQAEAAAKAGAETSDRLRDARREQSRIKVAAGEAGLTLGGSIDDLLRDSQMQAGLAAGRIKDQEGIDNAATTAEANSMLSRIESPTLLGAGLQIANAGVQGYATGQSLKIARQPRIVTP